MHAAHALTHLCLVDSSTSLFGRIQFQWKGCLVCLVSSFIIEISCSYAVSTLIRHHAYLRRLIWVYTICQCPFCETLGLNELKQLGVNLIFGHSTIIIWQNYMQFVNRKQQQQQQQQQQH